LRLQLWDIDMKKGLPIAAAFLAVVLAGPLKGRASDHADGPQTALDLSADITDLYTFTSPKDPSKLVLVLNVHSLAISHTTFSDAVEYKFRIRQADGTTLKPGSKEQNITCTFTGGNLFDANQKATCTFDLEGGSDVVTFDTRSDDYKAGGSGQKDDIKVFAGVRSDTWFLDLARTVHFSEGKEIFSKDGHNGLEGTNVLSIVVEMDKRRVGGPLLAVTAQTVRK
jgi:hypothetical protein